jgi:hypothetical protein
VTLAPASTPKPLEVMRRSAVIGFAFAAAAFILLGEALANSDRPTVSIVWGSIALSAYAVWLLYLIGPMRLDDFGLARWKIGPWTILWYGVIFGITTITVIAPQTGLSAEITLPSDLRALWLVAVGMTALTLGYLVGPSRNILRLAQQGVNALCTRFSSEVRSPAVPWILYAIGILASIFTAATTGKFGYVGTGSAINSSSYGEIVSSLELCAPFGIAAAALRTYREHLPGTSITLIVLLLGYFAFGAVQGGKESFVIAVLAAIIPFSVARGRLPKAATITIVGVFLIIVIPFNQTYRAAAVKNSFTASQAVNAAPGILRQTLNGNSLATALPQSLNYMAKRIREIDNVAIIVQRTPDQIGFRNPIGLVAQPLAGVVPRALWPGKPIPLTGTRFTQEFYESPPDSASSDTLIGGFYWYGGWLPLLAGMFVVGCAVRIIDEALDVRNNPHAIFITLLLFPTIVRAEDDWVSMISSIPATVFVWLLAVALTFRSRRRA